jgi:hypothetical protein
MSEINARGDPNPSQCCRFLPNNAIRHGHDSLPGRLGPVPVLSPPRLNIRKTNVAQLENRMRILWL